MWGGHVSLLGKEKDAGVSCEGFLLGKERGVKGVCVAEPGWRGGMRIPCCRGFFICGYCTYVVLLLVLLLL